MERGIEGGRQRDREKDRERESKVRAFANSGALYSPGGITTCVFKVNFGFETVILNSWKRERVCV